MNRSCRLLLTASLLWANLVDAQEKARPAIVDTHVHFYDPTRPQGVPWPGKNDAKLYRPVLPDEFNRLARPFGVVGSIVVEASPWVEDNQWLLDLAEKEPTIVAVIGRLEVTSEDFEKHLQRFAKNPLYRGIRISHADVRSALKEKAVLDRLGLLSERNLTLDVNGGPDLPADVALLAAKLPKLRIVINHAANLRIDGKTPPDRWREGMVAAGKQTNVYCKVSALVEQTGEKPAPRNVDYYRPVLDVLWTQFGEDRLLFGSNWPVADRSTPYATIVGITQDFVNAKGEQAAAKFFLSNSQSAYGWRLRPNR